MTATEVKMRSIDALINSVPEAQPINYAPKPVAEKPQVEATDTNSTQNTPKNDPQSAVSTENLQSKPENPASEVQVPEKSPEIAVTPENVGKVVETAATPTTDTDEYGNPIPKARTYTEDEVQQMIRDRLKRGSFRQEQQPTPQQVQQAQSDGFQFNENSELSWSQQLEGFVENTMQKVNERQQARQAQAIQQQAQVEFESKFHAGMAKYPDFVQTLADKPVTDDMMMAVRGLENPAAFLYTAAKRMPGELDRIAKIRDPYQQVAEMGRLHERLSKSKTSSNAPRPVTADKSDISEKTIAKVSIDHLIAQDAQARYRR